MEDLMIAHDGVLSEDVLERVKKGVLRKLGAVRVRLADLWTV